MKQFAAADLTRNTGDLFEQATRAPVAITKHRKPRFVMMSMEHYEQMAIPHGPQRAFALTDLPPDIGVAFDQGIKDYLGEQ